MRSRLHSPAAHRAAIARLGGAPLPTFAGIKAEDGLHFVPLEEQSDKYTELLQVYAPNFLKSELYPGMIPHGQTVLGIANATVPITYAWPENSERYKRIARFGSLPHTFRSILARSAPSEMERSQPRRATAGMAEVHRRAAMAGPQRDRGRFPVREDENRIFAPDGRLCKDIQDEA